MKGIDMGVNECRDGRAGKLATAHVDWLLEVLRPLLISQFIHGYKHGHEDAHDGGGGAQCQDGIDAQAATQGHLGILVTPSGPKSPEDWQEELAIASGGNDEAI